MNRMLVGMLFSAILFTGFAGGINANASELDYQSEKSIEFVEQPNKEMYVSNLQQKEIPIDSRANMKPTTYYIGGVYLTFSGSSAPSTMYYQTSRYGALYRGYLTRDYSVPILWGNGTSAMTKYYGTLYRNDLPMPSRKAPSLILEEVQK